VRRAGLIAAGTLGVVVAAGVVIWLVALRDKAEPVTVEEAVTSFRTDTEPTPAGPSPIAEGVYVYATRGFEKTDALTGARHRYPRRSTITVAAHQCGVTLTWRVLDGRSTEWVYCVTANGWELRSQDERHTFFGRMERTTYRCESTPIKPAVAPAEMPAAVVDCETDDTAEEGLVAVVGSPSLLMGGETRETIRVRKETTFRGAIRGTARHDLWFDEASGLPIRIDMMSRTTNDSPIGEVRYEEDVTLRLRSLEPRR
jgi:hypothetical protein